MRGGATHLILSDERAGPDRAAIPMILATGAVHVHLLRQQLRTFTSLNVRSGECLDVHHFAVLVGVGATTVNAYVAEASIADRHGRGLFGKLSLDDCLDRFRNAIDQGLLKVMSKMGIAVVSSYRGGANFEALGLSRTLVAEYFPNMPSRISGIGMIGIQKRVGALHARAWNPDAIALPIGGFYKIPQGRRDPRLAGRCDPHPAIGGRQRVVPDLQALQRDDRQGAAGRDPRPAGFRADRQDHLDRRGREHHRDPQALRDAGHVAGRACRPRRTARSTSP